MATTTGTVGAFHPSDSVRATWHRQIDTYPRTAARVMYLSIVVVATILLYYELYVGGAVSPSILAHYGMSFRFYVNITVVGNAVGAFSSLIAGLGDRWGRANMVTYGLLLTGLLVLFGVPHAPTSLTFGILVAAVGFVEGIILVATPALVRDFSPQLGRASAMGFWTLGPVVGSLCVSEVSSHTLSHLHAWQDQFMICGIAGLVIFAIAFLFLRELSPGLRNQLMVSKHDQKLIEAKAKGLNAEESQHHPWRQMLHVDVVGSAFAIAVFLIIYYSAVGFFTIYFTSIYGFSLTQANGIGNWFWAFDAIGLILVGIVSDILKVRKPFMVVGAVGAIVMTIVFLSRTSHPTTGYYTFVWIITLLSVFLAIAYAPWMASFTETVERHNPALTATGLAVWGWIIRAVVAISIFILPFVVSSTTPLVDYGTTVAQYSALYTPQLATISTIDPATLHTLMINPNDAAAGQTAVSEVASGFGISSTAAVARLQSLATVFGQAKFQYVLAHIQAVEAAGKASPNQWRTWWWVCVGGEVVFLPLIFLMTGRWRPKKAREDAAAHERGVEAELALVD